MRKITFPLVKPTPVLLSYQTIDQVMDNFQCDVADGKFHFLRKKVYSEILW